MNLTFRLIYAAHCNGSHHKLAVDSLRYLKDDNAKDWRNLFLGHIEAYIQGSKAPDKDFKDFKNHVLHVRDNFWGGAADKSAEWYDRLVHNLKLKNWREAAYSAGVLSHYYADAMHPFHTAQSEAESNVHRAVEWSISKTYDDLFLLGLDKWPALVIDIPSGDGWVKTLVENNATFANQYYETLITHYDFHKGVVDPTEGFDKHANEVIAKLIRYNTLSFSQVMDCAFAQAGVMPAKTGLTVKSFLAALKTPLHWVIRKMKDGKEQKLVQAIYDELQDTGTVETNLSDDDSYIKRKYEEEVLSRRSYYAKQKQTHTLFAASRSERRKYRRNETKGKTRQNREKTEMPFHPGKSDISQVKAELAKVLPTSQNINSGSITADTSETITYLNNTDTVETANPSHKKRETKPRTAYKERYYLSLSDPVADGPSVGDKTAKRLGKIDIHSVSDLIQADPHFVAKSLGLRNVGHEEVSEWQGQANLMCHIAGLKAIHSRLLVAGGIWNPEHLATVSEEELTSMLTKISLSEEGQKILRNKDLPSSEVIAGWIEVAKGFLSSKAA